jgi:TPR repeat protein
MLKDHNYNKELPMIHQISHQDLEHVYADAVNTIQCEMNFVEAVKALEDAAKAGHGKAAMFLAELYYQGFRVERDSLKAQYWQKMATMQATASAASGATSTGPSWRRAPTSRSSASTT